MTAFGKILVFLNLVFALLVGGLIGMVYLTRTSWKVQFDKMQAGAIAADASYKELLKQRDEAIQTAIDKEKSASTKRDELAKQLQAAKDEAKQIQDQLEATKRNYDKDAATTAAATAELQRSRTEAEQIKTQLVDRNNRVADLEKQLTATRNEAVNNQLSYNSLKERFQGLMTQNEEMAKQIARTGPGGVVAAKPGDKGPPPEQVRGTIKAIDGNLATISIGTDAGVMKDHTLYVFRVSPEPKYLGQIRILTATPFEAVGRLELNQRNTVIKQGDEVASRIAGLK